MTNKSLFRSSCFSCIWHLFVLIALMIGLICGSPLLADDWQQWFGPHRDGIWREENIVDSFSQGSPIVKWRTQIGAGYSGPSVASGRVYITDRIVDSKSQSDQNTGTDRVLCLDEESGAILWNHSYRASYSVSYPSGPRATPSIDEGRVFSLGTEGMLFCLDAETGSVFWKKDLKTYNPKTPIWGHAASPLIDGERVIVIPGGEAAVVAFHKKTGAEIWRSLSAKEPGYCPPIIISSGGTRQLIIWHPESINSLNPETGKLYWSIPWKIRAGLTIATPRFHDDQLFLTSFYNGSTLLKLDPQKPKAALVWQSQKASERDTTELHSIISTPVWASAHIYGICSYGQLRCIESATGKRLWESFAATTNGRPVRWATAFITPLRDRYFLFNEHGELILAHLSPEGYREIDRAQLLKATNADARGRLVVWSHPAYANGHIIVRNDQEIIRASLTK